MSYARMPECWEDCKTRFCRDCNKFTAYTEEIKVERDPNYYNGPRASDRPVSTTTIKETMPEMRSFEGGATRNTDEGKLDFEGLLSPFALKAYCEYMHSHRKCADGTMRDSDNWQSGFGPGVCMKSMMRHVWDAWMIERGGVVIQDGKVVSKKEALCAAAFNIFSQLHDMEKPEEEAPPVDLDPMSIAMEEEFPTSMPPTPHCKFHSRFVADCSYCGNAKAISSGKTHPDGTVKNPTRAEDAS